MILFYMLLTVIIETKPKCSLGVGKHFMLAFKLEMYEQRRQSVETRNEKCYKLNGLVLL